MLPRLACMSAPSRQCAADRPLLFDAQICVAPDETRMPTPLSAQQRFVGALQVGMPAVHGRGA